MNTEEHAHSMRPTPCTALQADESLHQDIEHNFYSHTQQRVTSTKGTRRIYDPAEHRLKHCWNQPEADFQQTGSSVIGKCPNTLDKNKAEDILQEAVADLNDCQQWPKRLWAVHEGVIYEAVPSEPNKSYHGYPWRGRPGRNRLSRTVLVRLREMADRKQCRDDFEDWYKKHAG